MAIWLPPHATPLGWAVPRFRDCVGGQPLLEREGGATVPVPSEDQLTPPSAICTFFYFLYLRVYRKKHQLILKKSTRRMSDKIIKRKFTE